MPEGRAGTDGDLGERRARTAGPAGADSELALAPDEELSALSVMRAVVLGNALGELPPAIEAGG